MAEFMVKDFENKTRILGILIKIGARPVRSKLHNGSLNNVYNAKDVADKLQSHIDNYKGRNKDPLKFYGWLYKHLMNME